MYSIDPRPNCPWPECSKKDILAETEILFDHNSFWPHSAVTLHWSQKHPILLSLVLKKKQIRKSAPPQREQEFPPQIVHKDCITAVADLAIPFVEECRWFWSDTKAPLLPSCGNTALLSVCQAKHFSALSSMCVQRPHLESGGQPGWDLTIYWKSWRKKNLISNAFKRGIKCKLDGLKLLYLMSSA